MRDLTTISALLVPATYVFGSLIIGLIIERFFLSRIKAFSRKNDWHGHDILIKAVGYMPVVWVTLLGAYLAIHNLPLTSQTADILGRVLLVVVMLTVTFVAARTAGGFTNSYARSAEGLLPSTSIFANIVIALTYLVGVLIILQFLGISITPVLTALGVGGLAVALALQDTLSSLFAGLHIIASKKIRPGDYIRLESGEKGYVTDITWRNTLIQMIPNNTILVPNSKLASSIVTNYHLPERELAVCVDVGISYESDLAKAEQVAVEVAREVMVEVPGGVPDFEPFIRYHTFNDSSIDFTVIMRATEFTEQYPVVHEFIKRSHRRFRAEEIEIPFPIRTVYLEKSESG